MGPRSGQALTLIGGRAVCRARRLSPRQLLVSHRVVGGAAHLSHLSGEDLSFISTHSRAFSQSVRLLVSVQDTVRGGGGVVPAGGAG